VDPTDGSCWGVGFWVFHLAADGSELSRTDYGVYARLSLDTADHSLWLIDMYGGEVVHRAADGTELARRSGLCGYYGYDADLVADPVHGSCWLMSWLASPYDGPMQRTTLTYLDGDGSTRWQRAAPGPPEAVAVNPRDNSCYVVYRTPLTTWVDRLNPSGSLLLHVPLGAWGSTAIAVDPRDGSFWAVRDGTLTHFAPDGAVIAICAEALSSEVSALCVDAADGSCWVTLLGVYAEPLPPPSPPDTSPVSVRVIVTSGELLRLSPAGELLLRVTGLFKPRSVSANPLDGSCWVGAWPSGELQWTQHYASDGTLLWQGGFGNVVCVDPTDGSCWTSAVHLSSEGAILWQSDGSVYGAAISVNPADGSCWFAAPHDTLRDDLVAHVAADGTELFLSTSFSNPASVAASPGDGSCWVADSNNLQVVRLVSDAYPTPRFADLPLYFWAYDQIVACADAGIVAGYLDSTYRPILPVTRDAMAVFISRALAGGDSLVPTGPASATFADVPTDHWSFRYVEYAVGAGVVTGYGDGSYRPTLTVTRDAMAVFIARALAGGDGSVPPVPALPASPTSRPTTGPSGTWSISRPGV
jgi:hypothetical protein